MYGLMHRTLKWQVTFLLSLSFSCGFIFAQLHYSVKEELKHGSVVGNIAKDLSLNANDLSSRKFQIVLRAKKMYFNISLQNGDLYVAKRIDRERLCGAQQFCSINVEAVMENPLQFYTINIEILDINDNSPTFSKSTFDVGISESTAPGTRFALNSAKDPDLGSSSLQGYNLSDNNCFILSEKISINGKKHPELVLDKPLDRERQNYFELTLIAFDGGKPVKSGVALIKIKVHDVNDNYPLFTKDVYQVFLPENTPIGFLILQLNATDDDEGSYAQISYSLSDVPESARQLFTIDSVKGDIILTENLDFEMKDKYELTVEAKDGGDLTALCKVFIQIVDVNDNVPDITITSLMESVPEDSPVDMVIALVNTYDMDTGENGEVICHIDGKLPFQLVPSSTSYYTLVTSSNLDREIVSNYNITIKAEDRGSPPLSIIKSIKLSISDVNDNFPVFDKTSYVIYIPENNLSGTSLYRIQATDLDYEENARVMYSLLNNGSEDNILSSYISINSMTGILYAQRPFDFEQLQELQFQVMAKDGGSPSLSSNIMVRLCISDKNDNVPKILYPSSDNEGSALFEFFPHSAEKGYLVTKVIAVDADSGHNAWLSYHLLQVSDPSLLIIGQCTGEIRLGRNIPDVAFFRQNIIVLVKDNGSPSLSSTVTLNLVVAENVHLVVPEIERQPIISETSSNVTLYLVIAIALISFLFIVTALITTIYKCRKASIPPTSGMLSRNIYPQFTLGCPSEISDRSLPFPFSYDVCGTLDSKQNEIAYLKPIQNIPTDSLIDTEDMPTNNGMTTINNFQVTSNILNIY